MDAPGADSQSNGLAVPQLSLHLALRIAAHFDVPIEIVFSLTPFKRLGQ